MKARTHDSGRTRLAARSLRKPLHSMRHELAGVRRNEDIECVHRMRVASRRLRNALHLFGEELPAKAGRRWAKHLKGVTRRLGAARDLDVQIEFLRAFPASAAMVRPEERPGIEYVLETLQARRAAAQAEVLAALDRLESRGTLAELAEWVDARSTEIDADDAEAEFLRREASRAVRERLGELFAYASYVEQPQAAGELHAMRIAAKHLRYTLEAYAPVFADQLAPQIQWSRRLQTWLGEIHDCDVWEAELAAMMPPAAPARKPSAAPPDAAPDAVQPGIMRLRADRAQHRAAVYAEFVAAWRQAEATGQWTEFRAPFEMAEAEGGDLSAQGPAACSSAGGSFDLAALLAGDERLRPVVAFAESCHYETAHTHQVLRLALRLFDELHRLHGLDEERRYWLACAALLHDIGWIEGRAGHHKVALRMILETPSLPWGLRERRIVGLIARYHRRSWPAEKHRDFAALDPADRADVRTLSAILRLADALDYSHQDAVAEVAGRVSARRLEIDCLTTRPAEAECSRAMEKGDLAVAVFGREVRVRWRLREPNPADRS